MDLSTVLNASEVIGISRLGSGKYNLVRFEVLESVVTVDGQNYTATVSSGKLTIAVTKRARFISTVTEKGRSKVIDEVTPDSKTTDVDEALLVLSSVEKNDESSHESIVNKVVSEVSGHAGKLKVNRIIIHPFARAIIHPFAHLFADLSKPETALEVLKLSEEGLIQCGFEVIRTPFGWFNSLELKAKGHPLSRVARVISNS
jgi:threonyl-tRNA synthetase